MQERRVRSLGWDIPLEEGMATRPSILAWRIPWTEEPGGLQSTGSQRIRHDLVSKQHQQMMYGKLCLEILSYFISEVLIEHRLCIRLEDSRKEISGTFPVVQWLRLCIPNSAALVPSLVGELNATCND